jgi:hypothetical protein
LSSPFSAAPLLALAGWFASPDEFCFFSNAPAFVSVLVSPEESSFFSLELA